VIHSFGATGDGIFPYAQMIFDAAGNLYGTTAYGAPTAPAKKVAAPVFELSPKPAAAGRSRLCTALLPALTASRFLGGVALDAAGNLYGATSSAGLTTRGLSTNSRPKPVAPGRKPSSTTLPAEPPMDGCLWPA